MFHWSEDTFWRTSLRAWDRAVRGYAKSNGVGAGARGMTRARYEQLKAEFENG